MNISRKNISFLMKNFCLILCFFCLVKASFGGFFPAFQDTLPEELAWHLSRMEVFEAQKFVCGQNIVVAHLDSGINLFHPDLAGRIVTELAYDFGEDDQDVTDLLGHGTATAGVILQVAPCARILPLKINEGFENNFATEAVKRALVYLLTLLPDHPEIRILNASIVMDEDEEVAALFRLIKAQGVIVIAPTGNEGRPNQIDFPASLKEVLAVTGVDETDHLYPLANIGQGTFIAAPAERIWAPFHLGGYQTYSGTSIAAALVSGTIALLLEQEIKAPELSLAEGARDLFTPGYDYKVGFGRVSALGALSAFNQREAIHLFPKRLYLRPGEEGELFFAPPSNSWELTLLTPEVVQVSTFKPHKGYLKLKADRPGTTTVTLKYSGKVFVARITVSETPKAVTEFFIQPRISKAKDATFCLYISSPYHLDGPFTLVLVKKEGGFFKREEIPIQGEIPAGLFFSCWTMSLPENPLQILLTGEGMEASGHLFWHLR